MLAKETQAPPPTMGAKPNNKKISLSRDEGYSFAPDGLPIVFPSPLHLLRVIRPELLPYTWQSEELLRLGGYLNPYEDSSKIDFTPELPYMLCLPAANGSGKDMVIIATFAVWFALGGLHNFCFITSASHDQIKSQTNPHIRDLCNACNKHFGNIFRSVENYHVCTQTASEIKLYVTDEAGRAEGHHPRHGGRMAMVFNEAKTIPPDMWEAYSRCTGYSYWLEVSSPGIKSGHFYQSSCESIPYPQLPIPAKYYLRYVTAFDCPHIPQSHIERQKVKQSKEWFQSSILAQFSDFGDFNVIKEALWDETAGIEPIADEDDDDTYGIGGDLGAGGDENSFWLRKGPRIIDTLHFIQTDTTLTAEIFDTKFAYVKFESKLVVYLDDGGVGHSIIDMLVKAGWKIRRMHNQAAARNKREFLNLGAESYFHLERLLSNHQIPSYGAKDPILKRQIISRIADNSENGKFRLESKVLHRQRNSESPDRADGYVLCYYSKPLRLRENNNAKPPTPQESLEEFRRKLEWGPRKMSEIYGNNNDNANSSRINRVRRSYIVRV